MFSMRHVGLDLAVDGHLVADRAVEAGEREEVHAARIELPVVEHQPHVELVVLPAGQPPALGLVAVVAHVGVRVGAPGVVDRVHAGEPRVHVLRGEIELVVVIPDGAERLVGVADAAVLVHARIDVRVVVVVVVAPVVGVQRVAVALRGRVHVVQVGRDLVDPEAQVLRRQIVVDAHEMRLAVARPEHRPGEHAVEAPAGLARGAGGQIAVPDVHVLIRAQLVPLLRRKVAERAALAPALVFQLRVGRGIVHLGKFLAQANLGVAAGERADGARSRRAAAVAPADVGRVVVEHGLLLHQARQRLHPRPRARADDVLARHRAGFRVRRAQAQAGNRQKHPGARAEQSHLQQIAPAELRLHDLPLHIHRPLDQLFVLAHLSCSE
jgi:hypothetical protein